jgi:peptidyl-tRNA hydrolase, PTH1 family
MALFQRKKEGHNIAQPLYTVGLSQTLLIIGLGNMGAEYTNTRHNVGFMALDRYRDAHDDFSDWLNKKDLQCHLSLGRVGSTRVLLVKPTTMMNLSGESVQKVQQFYKITEADTLVVYDDIDIDFGTIKTRNGGGSAGHNGIKSLLRHASSDNFGRIRVGVGPKDPPRIDSADFVLQSFTVEQQALIPKIMREISAIIDERTTGVLKEQTTSVL